MQIINTIIPVFCVIFLGFTARKKGFIPVEYLVPANRLVYYIAIPAMVFSATAKASLKTNLHPQVLGLTLAALVISFFLSWLLGIITHISRKRIGTFIQNGYHGNLGYIGLAVCYYYLGADDFAMASFLTVFVMILQNVLSICVLQYYANADNSLHSPKSIFSGILGNPIIVACCAGISCSLADVNLPVIVNRTLTIISGMALPSALLLIGATLNFKLMSNQFWQLFQTNLMKLVLLPAISMVFYTLWNIPASLYTPALILLASPSATVSYVMAQEMKGDAEFAVATISSSTLFSFISYTCWLHLTSYLQ